LIKGIPLDPYRLQSYNRAELILMAHFSPKWVDPASKLLRVFLPPEEAANSNPGITKP
jgi:hypothetical protein